jgi:hypothetical protein
VNCLLISDAIGFPFSFGVFQAYYSSHEPFASEKSGIAAIGTTATGIMYFSAPFASLFSQRWPHLSRPGMAFGIIIMVASMIAASFCESVPSLVATQGVLYAIGGILAYFPSMCYVDEWFVAKKGFAYGVMWTGTGFSGIIAPFVLEWLLKTWGYRTALRVWAVIIVRPSHTPLERSMVDLADKTTQSRSSLPLLHSSLSKDVSLSQQ